MHPTSLFDARLTIPRSPDHLVNRQRVTGLLDAAVRNHLLTVVTGAAGTGKTLAVVSWTLTGHPPPPGPVAWLTVDRGLRSPAMLWIAMVRAVQRVADVEALAATVVPDSVSDDAFRALASALDGLDLTLVLDDLLELTGSEAWDTIDRIIRIVPPSTHLVLIARHDPPLSLHRLRLAGEVADIRAHDLAFTEDETRALLEKRDLDLPDEVFEELVATTEGWAAGLRLALMALEASPDPAVAARGFGGHEAVVEGYLLEEALRGIDPDLTDFLQRTCVTDRICAPLARALTGTPGAEARLRALARDNPLVVELTGSGWYRYHPLLLQMLRARLQDADPDLVQDLHRRASVWYERTGEWLLALEHAVLAEDHDLVARIALGSASVLMFGPDRPVLGEVLARIPSTPERPDMDVVRALGAFCRGEPELVVAAFARATPALPELPEPGRRLASLNIRIIEAIIARARGNADDMARASDEAIGLAEGLSPEVAPAWFRWRQAPRIFAGVAATWAGCPAKGRDLLLSARAHTGRDTQGEGWAAVYFLGHLALSHAVAGEAAAARRIALDAFDAAEGLGTRIQHEIAVAALALATAELDRGDPGAAARALERGEVAVDARRDPFTAIGLRIVGARRHLSLGDLVGARQFLATAAEDLARYPRMRFMQCLRAVTTIEVEIRAGDLARAESALAAAEAACACPPNGTVDLLAIPRGLLLLRRGRSEQARDAVAGLLPRGGVQGVAAWLLTALAEDRLRRDAAATTALARAIDLAARDGARAPFSWQSDRLVTLLRRHLEVVGSHPEFVESLLVSASGPPAEPPTVEALTDRELSVLAYLPTMSSNTEIADRLGISVNTVKQHLKAINRKLGVTTRRDAVRRARDLGLLQER